MQFTPTIQMLYRQERQVHSGAMFLSPAFRGGVDYCNSPWPSSLKNEPIIEYDSQHKKSLK